MPSACAWLRRTADWPDRRLAIWGESGRGKTHLLHIWAAAHGCRALVRDRRWRGLPELPARRHRAG